MQEQVYMRAYGTGKPTFTQPGGVTSTPTPTPVVTPPAQVTPLASAPAVADSRYAPPAAFDETSIRAQAQADLQRQIDAIKAGYAGEIQAEQAAGTGRLGQQRGLSTISGTRFSPRGSAEQQGVERMNQSAISAINADMNAAIERASAVSRGETTADIASRRGDAITEAQNYMTNLNQRNALAQDQLQFGMTQEQARNIALGQIGGQDTLATRQMVLDQQAQADKVAYQNATLDQAKAEAAQKNYQVKEYADGSAYSFDPATGQQTYLGTYAAPVRSGGGDGGDGGRYPTDASGAPGEAALAIVAGVDNGDVLFSELSAAQKNTYWDTKGYIAGKNNTPAAPNAAPETSQITMPELPAGRYGSLNPSGSYGSSTPAPSPVLTTGSNEGRPTWFMNLFR
jgi:hypothetical protein